MLLIPALRRPIQADLCELTYITFSTAQGMLWKWEPKECKSWKTGGEGHQNPILDIQHGHCPSILTEGTVVCSGLAQGPLNSESWMNYELIGSCWIITYQLTHSRRGAVVFNSVPTSESTRPQWTVPILWSHKHSWSVSVRSEIWCHLLEQKGPWKPGWS